MHESFFGGCALFISVHNFRSYPSARREARDRAIGRKSSEWRFTTADVRKSCVGSIDHAKLMLLVERRVTRPEGTEADTAVVGREVMEDGTVSAIEAGTPQGSALAKEKTAEHARPSPTSKECWPSSICRAHLTGSREVPLPPANRSTFPTAPRPVMS